MPPSLHYKHITKDTFLDVLSRYPAIAPVKLRELDTLRYETIPATVAQRAANDGKAYLTKDEVEKLMEWKLYAPPCDFLAGIKKRNNERTAAINTFAR